MTVRRSTTIHAIYAYPDETWSTMDLGGFSVEATDGGIGKVDETTHEIGSGYLIVDTGPWIFGTKVMLPVGVIHRIDENDRRIWVNLTKDQIKNAPEFDDSTFRASDYRSDLETYYRNRPPGPDYGKGDQPKR